MPLPCRLCLSRWHPCCGPLTTLPIHPAGQGIAAPVGVCEVCTRPGSGVCPCGCERSLPVTRGTRLRRAASRSHRLLQGETGPGPVPRRLWGVQLALGGPPASCCVRGRRCANAT